MVATQRALEHDFYTTPDGVLYPLTARKGQYKLTEAGSPLGNGLLDLATARGPLQDGTTVTFQRLNARELLMTISRQDCPRGEWWAARAHLLDMLRPNRLTAGPYSRPVPGFLRKYLPDGIDYRDLFVEARVIDFNAEPPDTTPGPLQCLVTFYAADPLYYGPPVTGTCTLVGVSGLRFGCPTCAPVGGAGFQPHIAVGPLDPINEWIFGGGAVVCNQTLVNRGTWHTFPVITITGSVSTVTITNLTTGETVLFNGPVPPAVTLTLDLTYGQKRAYDSAGNDWSGYLDGDVGEFHIGCIPEAPGGINNIVVTIGGGDPTTRVSISFRSPYMGI